MVSCAAPRPAPPPPPPRLIETDLAVRADPRIEVVDLHELPTQDPGIASVVGTVVNRGDEETARLTIRVEARDAQDRVLDQVYATPETERVAPRGTTRFQALLRTSREVVGYFAEALARWRARSGDEAPGAAD